MITDRYYMNGPEEGDKIDQTVFICDEFRGGLEMLIIREDNLRKRKSLGRNIAKLMNEGNVEVLS